MKLSFLPVLLLIISHSLQAIDSYQPGDTLCVWAASGLTLRKSASLTAAKLAAIPYGTRLIALNYYNGHDVEVEAVPGYMSYEQQNPPVMLGGGFAKVVFQGDTGFVFDGYLSKLPPPTRVVDKRYTAPAGESFEDWAKRNFGLPVFIKRGTWEYDSPSSAKWVYGNGFTADAWEVKGLEQRKILPDVSLEEAFLLFNHLYHYEWEVRHPSKDPNDSQWSHQRSNKYEWRFGNGACDYKILYLPEEKMTVITNQCSC